jgi:hypothetical protein
LPSPDDTDKQMFAILSKILTTLSLILSRFALAIESIDAIRAQQTRDSAAIQAILTNQQGLQAQEGELFQTITSGFAKITALLDQIQGELVSGAAVGFIFSADLDGHLTIGVKSITMTDTQQVTLSIQPVDGKGNLAPVDGVPTWLSSNTEVVTVTPAADGMSAIAAAVGPLGTATVSVKADADLGAGVSPITSSVDITVTGGTASTLKITEGTPTEQTPVPPPPATPGA